MLFGFNYLMLLKLKIQKQFTTLFACFTSNTVALISWKLHCRSYNNATTSYR